MTRPSQVSGSQIKNDNVLRPPVTLHMGQVGGRRHVQGGSGAYGRVLQDLEEESIPRIICREALG
jgi:hypothetical protein